MKPLSGNRLIGKDGLSRMILHLGQSNKANHTAQERRFSNIVNCKRAKYNLISGKLHFFTPCFILFLHPVFLRKEAGLQLQSGPLIEAGLAKV